MGDSMSDDDLDDVLKIADLLELTKDTLDKATQKQLRSFNLDISWSAIMSAIEALDDKATPAMIARVIMRKRHTVSYMLNKMEEAGMLKKIRDLDRKNRIRASLTSKGREIHDEYTSNCRPLYMAKIMSSLSGKEKEHLHEYLQRLNEKARNVLSVKDVQLSSLSLDQDFRLFKLVIDTASAISQVKQKELNYHRISFRRNAVLHAIQTLGDDATPAKIARYLQRQCNSITSIVNNMGKDGLLTISKLPNSRTRYMVKLTRDGYRICQQSKKGAILPGIISTLSKTQRQRLTSYLKSLRDQGLNELGIAY
jgi:DNA-binding MarR family transcriptional regulator